MGNLKLDGIEFHYSWGATTPSTPDRFVILKDDASRARFVDQLERHRGGRILELGIYKGGSAALAMLVAEPAMLVAVDISEPVEALESFRSERGLTDRLRTHYGVDQADRVALTRVLDDEFGEDPLDLVIDDASHLHDETIVSFEVVFPRLRPGGEFIIEDWMVGPRMAAASEELLDFFEEGIADGLVPSSKDFKYDAAIHDPMGKALARLRSGSGPAALRAESIIERLAWPTEIPTSTTLAAIVTRLAAATATRPGEIESFECTSGFITVVRGPADLPRDGWQLERYPGEASYLLGLD